MTKGTYAPFKALNKFHEWRLKVRVRYKWEAREITRGRKRQKLLLINHKVRSSLLIQHEFMIYSPLSNLVIYWHSYIVGRANGSKPIR